MKTVSLQHRRPRAALGLRQVPLLAILFVATLVGISGIKCAGLAIFGQWSEDPDMRILFAELAVSLSAASLALFSAVYSRTTFVRRWVLGLSGVALVGSALALWVFESPASPMAESARITDEA
jgi:hypothetical protein